MAKFLFVRQLEAVTQISNTTQPKTQYRGIVELSGSLNHQKLAAANRGVNSWLKREQWYWISVVFLTKACHRKLCPLVSFKALPRPMRQLNDLLFQVVRVCKSLCRQCAEQLYHLDEKDSMADRLFAKQCHSCTSGDKWPIISIPQVHMCADTCTSKTSG